MDARPKPLLEGLTHPPASLRSGERVFFVRIGRVSLLFALELLLFSLFIDTHALRGSKGLAGTLYLWAGPMASALVAAATTFFTFAFLRFREPLREIAEESARSRLSLALLAGHFCAIVCLGLVSQRLFGANPANSRSDVLVCAWVLLGAIAMVFGACASLAPRLWGQMPMRTGATWSYALGVGLLAAAFGAYGSELWAPTVALTFRLVRALLCLYFPSVIADPAQHIIGTDAFSVEIGPTCSGIEGVGLILVFSILWLFIFRRECRFPRAFLLIPAGMTVMWVLNGLRIALLIVLGNAGSRDLAVGGFHSQAGWIAFNAVAFGLAVAARRIPWLTTREAAGIDSEAEAGDPNIGYLAPLLVILATGTIVRAATDRQGWSHLLQFLTGGVTLWRYRSEYRRLSWRISWISLALGAGAFAIRFALDGLPAGPKGHVTLASPPGLVPAIWTGCQVLAAATIVPIADELAFRGFLMRRLRSRFFLSVDPRSVGFVGILVSSIAFGVLYADHWLASVAAGAVFAIAYRRRGSMGDAVAAHATYGLMLAVSGLLTGQWVPR